MRLSDGVEWGVHVCTVLAAAFYNLFASVLGGIEVVVVEEESIGNK